MSTNKRRELLQAAAALADGGASVAAHAADTAPARTPIWSLAEQVSKLSEAFELMPGDITFSSTPRTSARSSRAT